MKDHYSDRRIPMRLTQRMLALPAACLAMALCGPSAQAQIAGDTDEVLHNVHFQNYFPNVVVDPNPVVGAPTRKQQTTTYNTMGSPQQPFNAQQLSADILAAMLQSVGIDIPEEVFDVIEGVGDLSLVQINPTFGFGAQVDYGGYFEVNSMGDANIGVDYPVSVTVTYPAPNTIGCGMPFTIGTACVVNEHADMLYVEPPFSNLEIGPVLGNLNLVAKVGLEVSACIGIPDPLDVCPNDCCGIPLSFDEQFDFFPPIPIATPPLPPLLNFCEDAFAPGANMAALLGCTAPDWSAPILEGVQLLLDGYNQSQTPPTSYGIASFAPNLVEVFPPDLPSTLNITIPEFLGQFRKFTNNNITYGSEEGGRKLTATGSLTDITSMEFDLISLIDYSGIPTSISLGGGLASVDIGDISPTFQVDQDMDFEFLPKVHLTVDLGTPMAWTVVDPDTGVVNSGSSQIVNLLAGQEIQAVYPQDLSDPVQIGSSYTMDGNLASTVANDYFTSYQIRFMELALGDLEYTLLDTEIGRTQMANSPQTLMDHTINLAGFPTIQKAPFTLDPEKPIIDVVDLSIEDIVNVGGGLRQVVYKVVLGNGGDVRLNDVMATLDLGATYASASDLNVLCITSKDMEVNPFFNGTTDTQLLVAQNSLEVGATGTIELLIEVRPEISGIDATGCFGTVDYAASTKAYGVSPIGTAVESNVYHCTGAVTAPDIIASVDLGAAVIDELSDFTVYGTTDVLFRKTSALSQGNVGSTGRIMFENPSLFSEETATIIGDIHAGVELKLIGTYSVVCDYIQVGDSLILNGSADLGPIGAMSYPSECVSVFDVPEVTIPDNPSNVQVTAGVGQTVDLAPGQYKRVRHLANSVLRMTSGTYDIDTWTVAGDDARIEFNAAGGPVVVNIGKWQPANSPGLQMVLTNAGGTPNDVQYNYPGPQPVNFQASHVQGTIVAPNAAITFGDASNLEGRCYAEKVIFDMQSYYTDPSYLEEMNIDPACLPASFANKSLEGTTFGTEYAITVLPNPFLENTALRFVLERDSKVQVELFDMLGQQVMLVPATQLPQGIQQIDLPTNTLLPGGYLARVHIGDRVETVRLVKMR